MAAAAEETDPLENDDLAVPVASLDIQEFRELLDGLMHVPDFTA